jgi:drug/metabolite transporter (DMT)-like permease
MAAPSADHCRGIILTVTAVLVLSPDALLVRLIDTDPLTLIFWRGALSALAILFFLGCLWGRSTWLNLLRIGRPGLLSSGIAAIGTILFVYALRTTSVANTLVIMAATPLFSALLSRLFLGERVARRTWLAIGVGLGGILLLFAGNLGQGTLAGDLCALTAAGCWAGNLVLLRHARSVNMTPAVALGGALAALLALALGARPLAVAPADFGLLLLLGGLVLPLSFALITLGPRHLPAAEVSLILLLETFLGPLWVWWVLGEVPNLPTIIAGALILGTILLHSLASLRGTGSYLKATAKPDPSLGEA